MIRQRIVLTLSSFPSDAAAGTGNAGGAASIDARRGAGSAAPFLRRNTGSVGRGGGGGGVDVRSDYDISR